MARAFTVIMFVIVAVLAGCGEEEKIEEQSYGENVEFKKIVAVGDSLTAGYGVLESESYPFLLEQMLKNNGYNYQVINAGVSAETSSGTASRIDWILTLDPDIVILEIGANDGLRGIDTSLVKSNIDTIVEKLKSKDVVVLLAGMKMVWNLGPLYVKQFNSIYPYVAKKHDVVFFPFFLEDVATKTSHNQGDGIHPNAAGYIEITDNIYPYVLDAIIKREE